MSRFRTDKFSFGVRLVAAGPPIAGRIMSARTSHSEVPWGSFYGNTVQQEMLDLVSRQQFGTAHRMAQFVANLRFPSRRARSIREAAVFAADIALARTRSERLLEQLEGQVAGLSATQPKDLADLGQFMNVLGLYRVGLAARENLLRLLGDTTCISNMRQSGHVKSRLTSAVDLENVVNFSDNAAGTSQRSASFERALARLGDTSQIDGRATPDVALSEESSGRTLRSWVAGRHVAIVGPAPLGEADQRLVESANVIVLIKPYDHDVVQLVSDNRATLVYLGPPDFKMFAHLNLSLPDGVRAVITKHNQLSYWRGLPVIPVRSRAPTLTTRAQWGTNVALAVANCMPSRLTIVGMDLYTQAAIYRPAFASLYSAHREIAGADWLHINRGTTGLGRVDRRRQWITHNQFDDRVILRMIKVLVAEVNFGANLAEAVSMTSRQLALRYEVVA